MSVDATEPSQFKFLPYDRMEDNLSSTNEVKTNHRSRKDVREMVLLSSKSATWDTGSSFVTGVRARLQALAIRRQTLALLIGNVALVFLLTWLHDFRK